MRTDDIRHAILQAEVDKTLKDMGFLTHSSTYHETMPLEMVRKLQFLDTPTSFYLRARADRMAVHKEHPICFEWECKTRHPKTAAKQKNCAIEAYPLAQHIVKARLGVHILYCYRDLDGLGIDAGFWCHALPRIGCVMLTPRPSSELLEPYLRSVFCEEVLGYHVSFNYSNGWGSGDPFVLIEEHVVVTLPHWNMQIAGLLPMPEITLQVVK